MMPDRSSVQNPAEPRPCLGLLFCAPRAQSIALVVGLALLVLVVLGDLIWRGDGWIASHPAGDARRSFFYLREFGFSHLARGDLPLWNPHLFSGTPFVGSFQSAMLYPINLIYLIVPAQVGINIELALHLLLLGSFTAGWARGRGLSMAASIVAASITMFGATTSLRVLAGALSVLATFAWVPLLFTAIDRMAKRFTLGWLMVAGFATTMMLLAGHPPTVLMGLVMTGLYCAPAIVASNQRSKLMLGLAAMGVCSALIAGPQLGAGFEVASESVRDGGVSFEYATSFSFAPESLLTIVVPSLFGDVELVGRVPKSVSSYYGRWWYWDESAFVGVAGLALAAFGALRRPWHRQGAISTLLVVAVLLALGRYTPFYAIVFDRLPGFDLLRAPSKFMFFATLFLAMLAALGFDELRVGSVESRWSRSRAFALVLLLAGAIAMVLGYRIWEGGTVDSWPMLERIAALNERHEFDEHEFRRWSVIAGEGISVAGLTSLLLAALFWLARSRHWATWGIGILCVAEVVVFARANRGGTQIPHVGEAVRSENVVSPYHQAMPNRVLETFPTVNGAMYWRGYSIWGYDPVVLTRYSTFMHHTQRDVSESLDNVEGDWPAQFHPLHSMVRTTWVLGASPTGITESGRSGPTRGTARQEPGALERFFLVGRFTIERDWDAILEYMESEAFDPRREVVLESAPDPPPSGEDAAGRVDLLEESTDHLVLDVVLEEPAILVVTDSYARGWRASALPGSDQEDFSVLPGNLVLRAIPLEAGHQIIRVEYSPLGYRVGLAMSGLGILLAGSTAGYWWLRGRGAWVHEA